MFLGHQRYEDLKKLIGEKATIILAERFSGHYLYLPRTSAAVQTVKAFAQEKQDQAEAKK